MADRSLVEASFGYGLRGGYRWERWGVHGLVEHDMWVTTEHERDVVYGALNLGAGGEISWFDGRAHTSLALGASVLLFDTFLDSAGTTGFFLELQPLGVRWPLAARWDLVLDPLSFHVLVPVTDAIPLVKVEYRTTLAVEVWL